jgi:hypothetical protein
MSGHLVVDAFEGFEFLVTESEMKSSNISYFLPFGSSQLKYSAVSRWLSAFRLCGLIATG